MGLKKDATETEGPNKGGLSSPTSVSMQNTFIIKNADESFETNHKLIPKLKQQKTTNVDPVKFTTFVKGNRPTPRDGHTACVDSTGHMYIYGGDRHHMPFNDLYMIRLEWLETVTTELEAKFNSLEILGNLFLCHIL